MACFTAFLQSTPRLVVVHRPESFLEVDPGDICKPSGLGISLDTWRLKTSVLVYSCMSDMILLS